MFGWFASMNMQMLVRGFIVFELTGSFAALGLVSLANALPGLALSLVGGIVADRFHRRDVVQAGQLANMAVAVVVAAFLLSDQLIFEYLLASAVIQGTINALIMPSRQSMIPDIVHPRLLMNAVALNTAGMNVMRLVAPTVGGGLLATVDDGWVYVLMALLYLAGAVLMIPVKIRPQAALNAQTGNGQPRTSGLSDIVEGCRYMWQDKTVLTILSVNLLIVLFSMPYQMMLPGFAKEVLDAGPGRLGLLMSITGVGSLAGSLVIASLPARRRGFILLCGSLLMGVSLVVFSVSSWFWLTAGVMVMVGVGQAARMSLSNVLLQAYTNPEYRGRVMSIYMMEFSLVSFGTFVIGILSNVVGVQVALFATSVALVVIVAGSFFFARRLRRLD